MTTAPPPSYASSEGNAYPGPPGTNAYPMAYPPAPGMGGPPSYDSKQSWQIPPPPPPGHFQPAPGAQGGVTVVVANQGIHSFRPVITTCPFCRQQITTVVEYDTGGLTWLACGGLAIMGCWLGCCLIPFCLDECKDASHSCPSCKSVITRNSRL